MTASFNKSTAAECGEEKAAAGNAFAAAGDATTAASGGIYTDAEEDRVYKGAPLSILYKQVRMVTTVRFITPYRCAV